MKKYLPILVAFLVTLPVLLGACCSQHRPVHYHASPIARLRLHGDVAFSPLERGLIEMACRDLLLQSAGWVDVQVAWDFDMTAVSDETLETPLLFRREHDDVIVSVADSKFGGHLLGLTLPSRHHTFLVADRLDTPARWRHVVMHELLHSVGLDDLRKGRQWHAIMFHETAGPEPSTCLTRHDAEEMCRVLDCDPDRVNYCGS